MDHLQPKANLAEPIAKIERCPSCNGNINQFTGECRCSD